jgi:hypothetical protein
MIKTLQHMNRFWSRIAYIPSVGSDGGTRQMSDMQKATFMPLLRICNPLQQLQLSDIVHSLGDTWRRRKLGSGSLTSLHVCVMRVGICSFWALPCFSARCPVRFHESYYSAKCDGSFPTPRTAQMINEKCDLSD